MSQPLWKIKAAKSAPSSVSAGDAYQRALFWQSQRTAQDKAMYDKFLAGDVSTGYDELKSYLDKRMGIGSVEKMGIQSMKEAGLEKKTDNDDDLQETMFLNASIDWNAYSKYLDERKGQESVGSDDYLRIESRRLGAFETTQKAEESLWKTKFDTGDFSYKQYKELLQGRLNQYAEKSVRNSEIASTLFKLTPEYRKQELDQLFNNKAWGEKYSDNLAGYISSLKSLRAKYGEGSPEYVSVDGAITGANNKFTEYQNFNAVTNLGNQVSAKQGEVNQKLGIYQNALEIWRADPSAANKTALDGAWNDYNNRVTEYNSLFTQYQDAKSKPLGDLPIPDIQAGYKELIEKPAETILPPEKAPVEGAPPAAGSQPAGTVPPPGSQPTQPPQVQTPTPITDPYAGLYYLADPKMISKWYGEDRIVRGTNGKVYLKAGIAQPRYVSDPKEIPKLGEQNIWRSPDGKIYANPFA